MSKLKKSLVYVSVLFGLMCMGGVLNAATSAEKSLEKGIEAYRKQDNDKAMDYFVDVLMNGTQAQAARASNYIDAIHNQVGGIQTPVEVDISYPDQPTQTIVDPAHNLANYGTERLNTLATEAEAAAQEAVDALNREPKTLTEQIEARQLAGYLQEDVEVQPLSAQQAALLDEAAAAAQKPVNELEPTLQDVQAVQQQAAQVQQAAQTAQPVQPVQTQPVLLTQPTVQEEPVVQNGVPAPRERMMTSTYVEPVAQPAAVSAQPATAVVTPATVSVEPAAVSATPAVSSTFTDLTSESAIRARNLYTAQKIQSMTDEAIAALKSTPGVHLYLRDDGRPDAIDVEDGVLFNGNYFRANSLDTLNSMYELLALTQGAHYTILPSGSYTDDVTLSDIRQAMALKSYFVKRGISQGKLSYNMGLVDEEVPAKFSNLKGLSVVFDYDAKLPTRLVDNEEKETAPLLSMAIVPPCRMIDRSLGEAYAVDFSVLETVTPLDNWILQVILHGRDGKYYVVRQLEGFAPVYHQILWNGRKGIIGPELPCGKYTIVLTGTDLKGNKQVLRRRVVVKCNEEKPTTGSCQAGKCPVVATAAKSAVLNYKSARLWKKPGRVMRDGTMQEEVKVVVDVEEQAPAVVNEQATATSTQDTTYTHTKTVRNVVTTDTAPAQTVTTSSYVTEELGPNGAYTSTEVVNSNPYEMPYEDEYTAL